jgi:hypothetical protein
VSRTHKLHLGETMYRLLKRRKVQRSVQGLAGIFRNPGIPILPCCDEGRRKPRTTASDRLRYSEFVCIRCSCGFKPIRWPLNCSEPHERKGATCTELPYVLVKVDVVVRNILPNPRLSFVDPPQLGKQPAFLGIPIDDLLHGDSLGLS